MVLDFNSKVSSNKQLEGVKTKRDFVSAVEQLENKPTNQPVVQKERGQEREDGELFKWLRLPPGTSSGTKHEVTTLRWLRLEASTELNEIIASRCLWSSGFAVLAAKARVLCCRTTCLDTRSAQTREKSQGE